MPSFVYLIPALMFFGLGKVPALLATIIYSVPPVIRLTNVGIREVNPAAVEAALAFGSSYWQILFKVQLPLARPTIMVGINQTTMMALAMVVVASMIGGPGAGAGSAHGHQPGGSGPRVRGRLVHCFSGHYHRPHYPRHGDAQG